MRIGVELRKNGALVKTKAPFCITIDIDSFCITIDIDLSIGKVFESAAESSCVYL